MKLRIGVVMGTLGHRGTLETLESTLYSQFSGSKVKFSWTLLQNCIKNVTKFYVKIPDKSGGGEEEERGKGKERKVVGYTSV